MYLYVEINFVAIDAVQRAGRLVQKHPSHTLQQQFILIFSPRTRVPQAVVASERILRLHDNAIQPSYQVVKPHCPPTREPSLSASRQALSSRRYTIALRKHRGMSGPGIVMRWAEIGSSWGTNKESWCTGSSWQGETRLDPGKWRRWGIHKV
jgi:hypothetical protein